MRVKKIITLFTVTALTLGSLTGCGSKAGTDSKKSDASSNKKVEITNVSYDPTRELYEEYNKIFQKHWKQKSGQDVSIIQSHGGSGKQALVDSAQSRLRPVTMAALTTILGMIPLLPDAMFGSLAASIMGGLTFGTLITLLFIPVLYALFFHIKNEQ